MGKEAEGPIYLKKDRDESRVKATSVMANQDSVLANYKPFLSLTYICPCAFSTFVSQYGEALKSHFHLLLALQAISSSEKCR